MEPSKRLLFLSESIGFGKERNPGGGEFFAMEFLAEMINRGWEVSVVAPAAGPLFRNPALGNRVAWHPLDLSAKINRVHFFGTTLRWLRLSRKFRDHIFYGNGYATLKWLALAAALWRVRAFCHLHESDYDYYDSQRARFLSRFVIGFFAISDAVRDLYLRGARVTPARVVRVHNGVPVASTPPGAAGVERARVRSELDIPASAPIILMAARTDPLKGHEVFIRSIRPVRAVVPEAVFVILGLQAEGLLYERLQHLIDEEGVRVAIRGRAFCPDVRRFMRCADVVVVPSTQEGFGRTAIEAMAENTPVIASATGGLKEIIKEGIDGWLFPPGDHSALAERIIGVLADRTTAQMVARRGYDSARTKFSTAHMTDLIENTLFDR